MELKAHPLATQRVRRAWWMAAPMLIVLGLVGSSVGGLVMSLLGLSGVVPGLVGAVLGAVLLLFIYRLVKKG